MHTQHVQHYKAKAPDPTPPTPRLVTNTVCRFRCATTRYHPALYQITINQSIYQWRIECATVKKIKIQRSVSFNSHSQQQFTIESYFTKQDFTKLFMKNKFKIYTSISVEPQIEEIKDGIHRVAILSQHSSSTSFLGRNSQVC